MKNLLRVFIISGLVLFGSLYYYSGKVEDHYQDNASRYLDQTMEDVSQWQADTLRQHLSRETLDQVSDSQLQKLMDSYQHLGRYRSMDSPQISRLSAALSLFASAPRLSYSSRVQFDKGSAIMTATLTVENDRFKFYNFNLGKAETQPAGS